MTQKKNPSSVFTSNPCSTLVRDTKGEPQGTPDQIWHLGNVIKQVAKEKELATADGEETETHPQEKCVDFTQKEM